MVDWSTPFVESMLQHLPLIISCPNESLVDELMQVLHDNGIRWCNNDSVLSTNKWCEYKEETGYYISHDRRLEYCGKSFYEATRPYGTFNKCTYVGNEPDFEISDTSFETIISAGGVIKGGKPDVG